MTLYALPLFLEDRNGSLTSGTEFTDLNDRLRLLYKRISNSSDLYMIYNLSHHSPGAYNMALIALDFGLHTITFDSGKHVVPMKKWCSKISGGRKFVASDSQEYIWTWRAQEGQEWTCTNTSGYLVAYYSLKLAGEPHYEGSSGCTLTIDEQFASLAPEYLASLMIVRWSKERGGV
ncbi:hypothetical protein CYLTODRAFT_420122 [Cylindrobasidium torrendii FP15055 ss-10]|uniref:DUF6593 domain-containing protein n=1 Tax=Cylindrobasidium torrendii FP15055 ss-10 TaxID=1314674 RepID=A0A0D7BHR9_9AGAR|nr:hypothetical protein CYLTODRAFT_420122 [Cylindrobasidium torrendii FP15055 ss-10]